MTRLLALAAAAVVLWLFLEIGWARLKRALGAEPPARSMPRKPRQAPPEVTASLVRCSGCGVHVPSARMAAGLCERCREG